MQARALVWGKYAFSPLSMRVQGTIIPETDRLGTVMPAQEIDN